MILIAVLGFLAGVVFKTQALQSITVGFDDRNVRGGKHAYDILSWEAKEKALLRERMKQMEKMKQEQLKKVQEAQEKTPDKNK